MEVIGLLIDTLFIFWLLKGIYNWIRALITRGSLYRKLSKLCRNNGYELEKPRSPLASFFRFSKNPDVILRTTDREYLIRLVTCRARKRFWHFVSPEYAVRYMRFYFAAFGASKTTGLRAFERYFHLPPFDEDYMKETYTKNGETVQKQQILLFDPQPIRITCVQGGNSSVNAASGTEFDGWLIYNAKGFSELLKKTFNEK